MILIMAGCKIGDILITNYSSINTQNWLLFQLNLDMINAEGQGDTSSFVLNGEWHLIGNYR